MYFLSQINFTTVNTCISFWLLSLIRIQFLFILQQNVCWLSSAMTFCIGQLFFRHLLCIISFASRGSQGNRRHLHPSWWDSKLQQEYVLLQQPTKHYFQFYFCIISKSSIFQKWFREPETTLPPRYQRKVNSSLFRDTKSQTTVYMMRHRDVSGRGGGGGGKGEGESAS